MKKLSFVLIVALLAGILAACAPAAPAPTEAPKVEEPTKAPVVAEPTKAPEPTTAPTEAKKYKVALILNTTIKDGGYAQAAYEKLMEMKDKYNLEVSYQESVGDATIKDVLRNYAADGYDLVYAHELYFMDAVNEVAPEFPDIKFGVTGNKADHPNVVAIDVTNWQGQYLAGIVAGGMTKANKVAMITVSKSPIALRMVNSMYSGALSVNPKVEFVHLYTGSFDDVVKAKEMATTAIKGGADIVYGNCGMGTTGVIEAAKEHNTMAIGSVVDRNPLAPDLVLTSNLNDNGKYLELAIDGMIKGDLEWGKVYVFGVKEGLEKLAPYNKLVTQDVKDAVDKAIQEFKDGKIATPENDAYLWEKK